MSLTNATPSNVTRATAWKSFSKLVKRTNATPELNDYYRSLRAAAKTVLEVHSVNESTDDTPAELDDADEVLATLRTMLPAPAAIFTDNFYTGSIYPVRLLYDIAGLYQARYRRDGFGLSEDEEDNKSLVSLAWLCYILEVDADEAKEIVTEFKKSRTLTGELPTSSTRTTSPVPSVMPQPPPAASLRDSETPVLEEPALDVSNVDIGRKERVESLHHRNRRESATDSSAYAQSLQMKKSSSISQNFSHKEFSGALTESIEQTLSNYRYAATLYKLDDAEMATYFGLALKDRAKAFFISKVEPGMSFEDITKFMLAEYNSNSRQIQIRRMLEAMRIGPFKTEKGLTSDQEALTEMISTIDLMVPQCPPAFRQDENKISFLRQAILKEPWATTAIGKVDAGNVSWGEFGIDLHAALSLRREIEPAPSERTFYTEQDFEEAAQIFMTRYGRDPRYTRKHDYRATRPPYNRPRQSRPMPGRAAPVDRDSLSFEEAKRLNLCQRCRKDWTPGHRCNGQSIRTHVYNRMRRGDTKTHVIAELMQALEADPHEATDQEEDPTATHLVEGDISEIDAALTEEPNYEDEDTTFATHLLSSAFSESVVDSPIAHTKNCPKTLGTNSRYNLVPDSYLEIVPKPLGQFLSFQKNEAHFSDRREFDLDVTRAYLVKEAKRFSKPGFLVDIGAPKSVIGKKALNRVFSANKTYQLPRLRSSPNRFRFANESFSSIGSTTLYLDTPAGVGTVAVDIDVVAADIPPLLGLDVLDREGLTADTAFNLLAKRRRETAADGTLIYIEEWSVPMWRAASRHSYVALSVCHPTHFTRTQLQKLHRQFFHPSAEKLYNLLKRSRPENTTPATRKVLEDITARCDPCQRIRRGPTRFRVSLGAEGVRFNERVLMDIMYIGTLPILHMVDDETKFSAAAILHKTTAEYIWDTFLRCWAAVYTGLPNRILVDQGTQFGKSQEFIDIVGMHNVAFEGTGIEAHSSLGIGERYHQPLRNTYRKLRRENPNEKPELLLQFAVKGMNDTLGPEGIVPSLLVFGEYPPAFTTSENPRNRSPAHLRAKMANEARIEMAKHMGKARVARALKHAVPPSADNPLKAGEQVLVWKEKVVNNRIGEWLGPFTVDNYIADKKLVYVRYGKDNDIRPFGIAQVKRYLAPELTAFSLLEDIHDRLSYFREPITDSYPTEVLLKSDPRSKSPEMSEAIKKEVRGLFEMGTFKVILREEVPNDGNVLPGRFVLAIKSTEDGETKYKARFVIGGHRDKQKHLMVHNSATLQPQSIRLLLALSRASDFNIWTADVTQAYLQSTDPLLRDIFITKQIPEFELEPEQCLKLLKPLYGLCDAGDLWASTMDKHHRLDLGLKSLRSDPALYVSTKDGIVNGFSGSYVDDMLRAGNDDFRANCRKTHKSFQMGEEEPIPVSFTGFYLDTADDGSLLQHQKSYLKNLETLPMDADFASFRSMRMKLAWLAHTRADCLFEISQLAQVTAERFQEKRTASIRRLNKAIHYAVKYPVALRIPKLEMDTLKVVGFADASFANNHDLSTQLGHIVFLCDAKENAAPIAFRSYKSRRVVRSAMAGEVIAFSDMFDVAVTLAEEIRTIYKRPIPLHLLTDSKALFDIVSKGSRTSEKRMMLDIAAAREGFRDRVISDIGFVRSSSNLADGLTKPMQQAALQDVLKSGKLHTRAEQWIIRN